MQPEDFSAPGDQGGAGQLQYVAVFLKSAFETDGTSGCSCRGAATAAFGSGKQDVPPGGSFQTHGPVAFALGIRDADSLGSVAAAEACHFGSGSLHHTPHPDAAFKELRERLTQLREGFRVKRSAKMAEPENQRRTLGPELGEAMRFAGGNGVDEIRSGVAQAWFGCHERRLTFRRPLSYRRNGAFGGRARSQARAGLLRRPPADFSQCAPVALADAGRAAGTGR